MGLGGQRDGTPNSLPGHSMSDLLLDRGLPAVMDTVSMCGALGRVHPGLWHLLTSGRWVFCWALAYM
jgi:hypothetical protein